MRKLLNKPWVVALLALAAIALVAQSVLDRPQPRAQRPVTAVVEELPEDAAGLPPAASGSLAEALASLSFPDQLPDPFAPRRQRAAEAVVEARESGLDVTETVRLSAIWEQDGSAFVLLNGRICRSGDSVGRITLVSIERDGVWLAHWKGRDFVRLGQDFTLVTPAAAAAKPRTATHEG
jgi:hypothetical protein